MKKGISLLLIAAMSAMTLAGCSNSSSAAPETKAPETEAPETEAPETEAPETEAPETDAAEIPVMTHEEFAAAEIEDQVCVETYVQAKQGWWEDNGQGQASIYTQAEDGAYFLYNLPCTEEEYAQLTEGTKIKVTGYKAEWAGEVEIIDAVFEIEEGNYVAEAVDVTELLGTDELIAHQNEKVSFTGLTVEDFVLNGEATGDAFKYSYDGSGSQEQNSDLYFQVSYNGQTYQFTVESYLCGNTTDVYKAVEALQVGDVVDMEGFLYWYEGANPHITSVTVK
ncbi:MAG: hypothetical protein K5637_04810 [Lachnospiraceae bacterium]|nr:hypothetical protein [Lachnospiraceae bacterium]